MNNSEVNGLTKDDVWRLYKYLVEFENKIKGAIDKYDIESNDLKIFLEQKEISFGSLNNDSRKNKKKNYFLIYGYENNKNKAYTVFRHLRNSIAHASISKENKNIFRLSDKMKKNITMDGRIKVDLFYELLKVLINSKK